MSILAALFWICVICIVVGLIVKLAPLPAPVPTVLWAVVALICVVLLFQALAGGNLGFGSLQLR